MEDWDEENRRTSLLCAHLCSEAEVLNLSSRWLWHPGRSASWCWPWSLPRRRSGGCRPSAAGGNMLLHTYRDTQRLMSSQRRRSVTKWFDLIEYQVITLKTPVKVHIKHDILQNSYIIRIYQTYFKLKAKPCITSPAFGPVKCRPRIFWSPSRSQTTCRSSSNNDARAHLQESYVQTNYKNKWVGGIFNIF